MYNYLKTELRILEEGPMMEIHIDALKATHKNTKMENSWPRWHTQIVTLKIHLYPRTTGYRNEYTYAENIPKWMTKGKATVIQKNSLKRTAPNKYRSITCLPWKIRAAQIRWLSTSH